MPSRARREKILAMIWFQEKMHWIQGWNLVHLSQSKIPWLSLTLNQIPWLSRTKFFSLTFPDAVNPDSRACISGKILLGTLAQLYENHDEDWWTYCNINFPWLKARPCFLFTLYFFFISLVVIYYFAWPPCGSRAAPSNTVAPFVAKNESCYSVKTLKL